MTQDQVWAILPLKNLGGVKTRLEGVLTKEERQRLVKAMAEDVFVALKAAKGLAGIAVVSHDEEVAAWARAHSLVLIDDTQAKGLSAAVSLAANHLTKKGATAMLCVLADIPLVVPGNFDAILEAHADSSDTPHLIIAPSRDGDGSNCMLIAPPDAIPFHYGGGSCKAHLKEAKTRNLVTTVLDLSGTGHDIDTREDLLDLVAKLDDPALKDAGVHTKQFLTKSGIAARLKQK